MRISADLLEYSVEGNRRGGTTAPFWIFTPKDAYLHTPRLILKNDKKHNLAINMINYITKM